MREFRGFLPQIHPDTFVADGAHVIGKVTLEKGVSIWFNAVVRGDVEPIDIGGNTNIQDNCVLHADPGYEMIIGKNVTIGHLSVLHGCNVGDGALIGMGTTALNGAMIGEESLVAAHSLVPPGFVVPPRTLVMGVPCKIIRELSSQEIEANKRVSEVYLNRWQRYYMK